MIASHYDLHPLSDDHPDLKRKRDLLTSIPGIGETTAGSLLAEIPHLDRMRVITASAAKIGLWIAATLRGTRVVLGSTSDWPTSGSRFHQR